MSNMIIEYLEVEDEIARNHKVGCIVGVATPEIHGSQTLVCVGISMCNIKIDRFDKKLAKNIAHSRANIYARPYPLKRMYMYFDDCVGIYLPAEISTFMERCKRYFQDDIIVYPSNIEWR